MCVRFVSFSFISIWPGWLDRWHHFSHLIPSFVLLVYLYSSRYRVTHRSTQCHEQINRILIVHRLREHVCLWKYVNLYCSWTNSRIPIDYYFIRIILWIYDSRLTSLSSLQRWQENEWMKPTIFHVLFKDYTRNEIRLHEYGKFVGVYVCVFGVKNFIFIQYKMLLECLNRACWLRENVFWSAKASISKRILTNGVVL